MMISNNLSIEASNLTYKLNYNYIYFLNLIDKLTYLKKT